MSILLAVEGQRENVGDAVVGAVNGVACLQHPSNRDVGCGEVLGHDVADGFLHRCDHLVVTGGVFAGRDDVDGDLRRPSGQLRKRALGRKARGNNAARWRGGFRVVGIDGVIVGHGAGKLGAEVGADDLLDFVAQGIALRRGRGAGRRGVDALARD